MPVAAIGFWQPTVSFASVPKTTVHKDHDALLAENEIGFAKNLQLPSPSVNAVCAEQLNHSQLSVPIASAADARHHGGAFIRVENVGAHNPKSVLKKPRLGKSGVPTSSAR